MEFEEWRVIARAPDYQVSSLGRVRRLTPARGTRPFAVLRPGTNGNGDLTVRLSRRPGYRGKNKNKSWALSTIVAVAFLGVPKHPNDIVRCINGDRTDLRVSNIRWEHRPRPAWLGAPRVIPKPKENKERPVPSQFRLADSVRHHVDLDKCDQPVVE